MTHYYFVCADAVADESVTNNNCSAAVGVVSEARSVDLTVIGPNADGSGLLQVQTQRNPVAYSPQINLDGAGNSKPHKERDLRFSVVVRNLGNKNNTNNITLHYIRSADDTITMTAPDTVIETVSGMAPLGLSIVMLKALLRWLLRHIIRLVLLLIRRVILCPRVLIILEFAYLLMVIATPSNNCTAGYPVTIQKTGHDLVVQARNNFPHYFFPSSLVRNGEFKVTLHARNVGNSNAGVSNLGFYRSSRNFNFDPSNPKAMYGASGSTEFATVSRAAGTGAVRVGGAGLDLGRGATGGASLPNQNISVGTYYYGVCLKAESGVDVNPSNDCIMPQKIDVVSAVFDVEMVGFTRTPATAAKGTSVSLTATIKNNGPTAAANVVYKFYRSKDNRITRADTPINQVTVASIANNAEVVSPNPAATSTVPLTLKPGDYWYGACIDPLPQDTNRNNDCTTSAVALKVVVPKLSSATASCARPDVKYFTGESCKDTRGRNNYTFTVNDNYVTTISGTVVLNSNLPAISVTNDQQVSVAGTAFVHTVPSTIRLQRNSDGSVTITGVPPE